MTEQRDITLEALFADAEHAPPDPEFTHSVTREIQRRRWKVYAIRASVIVMIGVLELVLESPLQQSLGTAADLLSKPVIAVEGDWIEFILGPINTAAGVVGIVLLGLHVFIRRVVH
ncbi:MAG: hypothetical protein AAFV47_11260 [Pseudomonadota bacterium]